MPSGEKDKIMSDAHVTEDDTAMAPEYITIMEDSNEGQQQVLAMADCAAAAVFAFCVTCLSFPCACAVHVNTAAPTKPTKNNIWHCFLSDKEVQQDVRDLKATEEHKQKHRNTIARELWARVMAGDADIIARVGDESKFRALADQDKARHKHEAAVYRTDMIALGYTDQRINEYLSINRPTKSATSPQKRTKKSGKKAATPPTTPKTSARTWRGCTCSTEHSSEFTDKADETQVQCTDCRQWCRWGCTTVARHQFVIEKDFFPFQKNCKFTCSRCSSSGAEQFTLVRSKGYKQSIEDIVAYIMWTAQVLGATVVQVKAFLEGNAVLDEAGGSVLVPATLDGSDRWNIMRTGAPKNQANWPRPQKWTNNPTCYLSERLPGRCPNPFYIRPTRRSDEIRFGIPKENNWTPTPLLADYAAPPPPSSPPTPQTGAAVGGGYGLRPRQPSDMADDDYSSADEVSAAVPLDAEVDDEPVSPPPPPPLPRMCESTQLMFSPPPPTPLDPPPVVSWCPARTCVGICFCPNDAMDDGEHDEAFEFADFEFDMPL